MTQTKFTKGKWIANTYSVYVDEPSSPIADCGHSPIRNDLEELANANLIAAAPDMYAMLNMLVNGDSINDSSIEKEVINILKKARGE